MASSSSAGALASPAALNYLTLGLLIVYAVIAYLMWRSALVTERPHITIENLNVLKWNEPGMTVGFDVVNYGKSPAWLTRLTV